MIHRIKIWLGAKHLYKKDDIVQCITKYHDPDRYLILDSFKYYYIVEQYAWDKHASDFVVVPGSAAPVERYEIEKRYIKVDVKRPTPSDIWNKILEEL